jgi:hypothetical protein
MLANGERLMKRARAVTFCCNGCGLEREGRGIAFKAEELPGTNPVGEMFLRAPNGWFVVTCIIEPGTAVGTEKGSSVAEHGGVIAIAVCGSCAAKGKLYGAGMD